MEAQVLEGLQKVQIPEWAETGEVVEARAPGKVIICGEHAVVHGTGAVAAALDRYTMVRINRPPVDSSGKEGFIAIHLPDLELSFKWSVEYVRNALNWPAEHAPDPNVISYTEQTTTLIKNFVEQDFPPNLDKGMSGGVQAFMLLLLSILGLQPVEVAIVSELPLGAGLGSSAALCVSVAGALLSLAKKLELLPLDTGDRGRNKWWGVGSQGLDLVNMWAYEGEKVIHGSPSGVDNTVSCYGHVVHFQRGKIARLEGSMQLRMLITNTKVSRNTKALVAAVAERRDKHPEAMAAVFKAVDAIVDEVVSILEAPCMEKIEVVEESTPQEDAMRNFAASLFMQDGMIINTSKTDGTRQTSTPPKPTGVPRLTKLEELIVMNQGLLQCMGVSHASIETICQIASQTHLCSKLTGAGGGGCVVTLLPNEPSPESLQKLKNRLQISGFECFEATVGGKGLQVGPRSSFLPTP